MSPSKSPRSKIAGRSPFHLPGCSPDSLASVRTATSCICDGNEWSSLFVMSDPAWPLSRCAQALPDQAISRVGSGASTAFPRRNWSPEPKEQESSRSAAPFFLNRGLGRGTTAFAPPDQEEQHDGSDRAKVPSARHAIVRPLIECSHVLVVCDGPSLREMGIK